MWRVTWPDMYSKLCEAWFDDEEVADTFMEDNRWPSITKVWVDLT